jgi:signal transduction histidine kinase
MRRALGDAEGKAEDLLALIEDLLEVARLEEAAVSLELQPIAPRAFLVSVSDEWAMRFRQDGARVKVDASDEAPVFQGDLGLLRRVFGNLIQNALTHSARGVSIALMGRRDTSGGVLFTVADDGPGIPPEYHEIIFLRFQRVTRPEIPRVRSSGLGLTFCKMAVEAHGGRIWVQSAEGRGSQFHIVLPCQPPRTSVPASSVTSPPGGTDVIPPSVRQP